MADLKNRKIKMFRCHLDPAIGPRPRNAFSKHECQEWDFELTPVGVYVHARYAVPGGRTMTESEHLVPFANVQSIQFIMEEAVDDKKGKKDSQAA